MDLHFQVARGKVQLPVYGVAGTQGGVGIVRDHAVRLLYVKHACVSKPACVGALPALLGEKRSCIQDNGKAIVLRPAVKHGRVECLHITVLIK